MEIPSPQIDGSEACVMPPEYEEYMIRKILWQEAGLHYDDTPLHVATEHIAFRELESKHPYRQERARRESERRQRVN